MLVGSVAFLRAWSADTGETERHRDLKAKWGLMLQKRTHCFLVAGQQGSFSKEILNYAKTKNVHLFGKKVVVAVGTGNNNSSSSSSPTGFVYVP